MAVIRAEALRKLAFGSIGASYVAIGSAITKPGSVLRIQNLTDALLSFSYDKTEEHEVLPPNGYFTLDIGANRDSNETGLYTSVGTTIYVKQIDVPSSGSVYVSTYYQKG